MSDKNIRWTPPNWPKGFVEVCDELGIRIAQPDDPIYQDASVEDLVRESSAVG